MTTKIYWINLKEVGENLLGIMPRPRGGDWLEAEIIHMKKEGIHYLISLLEYSEIDQLGLEKEEELCEAYGITFLRFPIEDVALPQNIDKFVAFINQLNDKISNSKKVVIHCRMGIGRSSLVAGAILLKRNVQEVFEQISKFRGLEVPDTEEQRDWLMQNSGYISR